MTRGTPAPTFQTDTVLAPTQTSTEFDKAVVTLSTVVPRYSLVFQADQDGVCGT